MSNPPRSFPIAGSDAVCAIEIGARYTTLTCGISRDNRIDVNPEYLANIELGGDVVRNDRVISNANLTELDHFLSQIRKYCSEKKITAVPGIVSAAVSRAANSADIRDLAGKYDFEVELLNGQRECELGYHAATHGLPNRLVCTLSSHSCYTVWLYDGSAETNYVEAGYEDAFEQFIRHAPSMSEACSAFGLHLNNHLDFLPITMDQLIVTNALPCAGFISGKESTSGRSTNLSRSTVSRRLRELQHLSKPDFQTLKKHTGNPSDLLPGMIFLDYLLNRTGRDQLMVTDTRPSTALIYQHFDNRNAAAG